jgi:glucose/arabinose dehydrogenase
MGTTSRLRLAGLPLAAAIATALAACGSSGPAASPSGEASATRDTAEASAAEASGAQKLRLVRVASGLDSPVHLAAPANERNRLYVVEQSGRIRVIENGRLLSEPFLDITELVKSGGEQGLLSVAFHPNYASNRLFYVDYTDTNGDTRVAEYRASEGGAPVRTRQLFFQEDPYANHNGGQLVFGPDGLLYLGTGDGGSGGDPENRAQNMQSQFGKLLRMDVDRAGADWEIAGLGLRNPWRFSFDRRTNDLYIGDVGQNQWEEIDFVASGDGGLKNYGWDVYEGNHAYEDKSLSQAGELVQPIAEYEHSQGCSVTGGFVYRGKKVPKAVGRYFFGDYCSGRIWSFVERGGKATGLKRYAFTVPQLSSFGESAAGELFLVSQNGTIYRLAKG